LPDLILKNFAVEKSRDYWGYLRLAFYEMGWALAILLL
jgi:hypothetical protein